MGLSRGWGSAGSVLRSQGTWGQEELSRYRTDGIRMWTFQCSLRPDPAAAGNYQTLSRSLEGFGWRTIGGAWATENLEPRATGRGWLKHDLIHR